MAASPQPPAVPQDAWRVLLDAALEFRALAPWLWMNDTAISVYVDEQNSPWFACVLGGGGEIFGLVLYRSEEGFRAMHALHVAESEHEHEDARFMQSAIDVTFGAKKLLDRHDLARLKALGYGPARGERFAWPSFRSHRPGYAQWHLDAGEVRVLTAALSLVGRFARSLTTLPNVYAGRAAYEFPTLSATATTPAEMEWRRWLPPPPLPVTALRLPDDALAARLRSLPVANRLVLELDLTHALAPTLDDDRPYFPRQASIVDAHNGMVLALELGSPRQDGFLLLGDTLLKVVNQLALRPSELRFVRPALAQALHPLAAQLGITRVKVVEHLPMTAEARASLARYLQRGF